MQTSLANRSSKVDHLADRLQAALEGIDVQVGERIARELANIFAELDHRLRADVDEALGRLDARIEDEMRDLAEEEQ